MSARLTKPAAANSKPRAQHNELSWLAQTLAHSSKDVEDNLCPNKPCTLSGDLSLLMMLSDKSISPAPFAIP